MKSLHFKFTEVEEVSRGNTCSIKYQMIGQNQVLSERKGLVVLDLSAKKTATFEFEGEVILVHNPLTIKPNYQGVIHCGFVRQPAKVVAISPELLSNWNKGVMRFRFSKNVEVVHIGADFIFREGRTKAVGKITAIFPIEVSATK